MDKGGRGRLGMGKDGRGRLGMGKSDIGTLGMGIGHGQALHTFVTMLIIVTNCYFKSNEVFLLLLIVTRK